MPARPGALLRWLPVAVVALGVGLAPAAEPRPFAALIGEILRLFPTVEGEVIEAEGTKLTLALGRREGLRPGIQLSLYREGRELRHPRTGEILGRTEQTLGTVMVEHIFETHSTGVAHARETVRPGDKARISAGRITLTLLSFSSGVREDLAEAIIREIVEELDGTGRFEVRMGDAIRVWLAREGIAPEELLQGKGLSVVGHRFQVEYLLALHVRRMDKKPYVEARLVGFPQGSSLLETAMFVPPSVKPPSKAEFSDAARPPQPRPVKYRSLLARLLGGESEPGTYSSGDPSIQLREVARLPFPVIGMDVAVSPKDRIPRLVITDGERIYLYRIVNKVLEPEWTYWARAIGRVVTVQLAELDGDGVLEVVANRYDPRVALTSLILTTRGGKATAVVDDFPDILLAVDEAGEHVRRTLWGQKFHQEMFFTAGQAERLVLKGSKVVAAGPVPRVPVEFRATGATFSNIAGTERRALVFVDRHRRLTIAVDGVERWRSSATVGGGLAVVEVTDQGPRVDRASFVRMEVLPLSVDLDGDGIEEVVVPQNDAPGTLAVVFRSASGYRLQSVNLGSEAAISGLGAIPGEDGPILVVAAVHRKGFLGTSGETQILMTAAE